MHIAILGRQPALGVAELERVYGTSAVSWFSDTSARVDSPSLDFHKLGGSLKAGRVVLELSGGNWRRVSTALLKHYVDAWQNTEHKVTLGISAYGWDVSARDVQGTGIILKKQLRSHDVSLRLVPNQDAVLSTATSHHNKLGANPHRIELLVVRGSSGRIIIAESIGSQNISAFAARDQARPKTDAFVGMLPPKLARMMINMTGLSPAQDTKQASKTLLDPFCGTGVVLQEAWIDGYNVYGTDISEKMVEYSKANMKWLAEQYTHHGTVAVALGDAMSYTWESPIDAVVCETYLGQPFSAPPSPAKLIEVRSNCDHIISTFLRNLAAQLSSGTPLCIAIPAWNDGNDHFTHLTLIGRLNDMGYRQLPLKHARPEQLLYYRDGQVVARELLLLEKT